MAAHHLSGQMDHAGRIQQIRCAQDRTGKHSGLIQDVAISFDHNATLDEHRQSVRLQDVRIISSSQTIGNNNLATVSHADSATKRGKEPPMKSNTKIVTVAAAEEEPDAECEALAAAYLKAVAAGDAAQLLRWCVANDGLDLRTATAFVEQVRLLLADMLCGRRKSGALTGEDMLRLCALMDRCAQYLKVNTGVRHIFGLLAVQSLPDSGNRG